MNPGNFREALIEVESDEMEGADILMVSRSLASAKVVERGFLSRNMS